MIQLLQQSGVNIDKEEQQQTIEALEAELSHYVQLCNHKRDFLRNTFCYRRA